MRLLRTVRTALGLSLLAIVGGTASAQAIRGELGPQSRAAIRITLSVMPRFDVSAGPEAPGARSKTLLRYRVELVPLNDGNPRPAANGDPAAAVQMPGADRQALKPADVDGRLLALIVPD